MAEIAVAPCVGAWIEPPDLENTYAAKGVAPCVGARINPWNETKIEVGYDDKMKTYDNIDDVMNDPMYHGKLLQEISDQLCID